MTHAARMLIGALILGGTLLVNGCVVEPRRPPPPPRPPGCVWVPGHFNAHGYWVPAYCRR